MDDLADPYDTTLTEADLKMIRDLDLTSCPQWPAVYCCNECALDDV